MNSVRRKRLLLIAAMVLGIAAAVALALSAFQKNLMFFYSPSEVRAGEVPAGAVFRLGGMVVEHSLQRPGEGLTVEFRLSDLHQQVTVRYTGILPDLFREGQGIVAKGRLSPDGVFIADEVLAKHDENYMPPEVAEMMQQAPPAE